MKIKGNLSLSNFHQSIISLALKTNELDEKIHLSISLPNHGEMKSPHPKQFKNPSSLHLECNPWDENFLSFK
jgi:hypothetical protein